MKTGGAAISDVIKDFKSVDVAAKALKNISIFDNKSKFTLLKGAFPELGDDAIKAALGIKEVSSAATGATSGVEGLSVALKGLWASIAPFGLPAIGAIAKKKYPLLQ